MENRDNPVVVDERTQLFLGKKYMLHKGQRYFKRGERKKGVYKVYYLHRVVWEYYNGKIPKNLMIDHINRNKSDNRIENLRLVDAKENRRNVAPEVNEKHRARMIAFNSQQYGKWWQKEGAREKRSREVSEYLLSRPLLKKNCIVCGNTFECKNSTATYCSSRCRQENYFKKGVVLWHQKKKITK